MSVFDFLDEHNILYHDKSLITQAFVHTSYANEHKEASSDNERLEYMGDAVLQIYSADRLFRIKPALSEGEMTPMRANLVCEKTLAIISKEFGLNDFLLLGQGEEKNGGRNRDSIVSDSFEAFIGAIYIDTDINNVFRLLDILMSSHIGEKSEDTYDYKTKLQEYVQADSRRSISYELVWQHGPSNHPEFKMEVKVDGLVYGVGIGSSKKEAEKHAAKDALEKLVK